MEQFFAMLIQSFGYLGVFLVSLMTSSTIIFPLPGIAMIFAAGAALNPLGVAVAAGLGASFGELTGYGLGWGSKKTVTRKYGKQLERIRKLFAIWGGDIVIFVFSVLPLPFDVIGIFCGNIGWDVKRFFAVMLPGKIIKFAVVAYAGLHTISWLVSLL
ncbi:MAG: VTT domain-containing protein [Candidatus Aenigmatarchaeota archaeon]